MAGKTCEICGKPSGMYPLCKACFVLRDEGKVVKCGHCGKWKLDGKPCPQCGDAPEHGGASVKKAQPGVSEAIKPSTATLTCIICGKDSNGMHFCKDCYYKYKDREMDIHVKHCTEFSISDEYGNLKYKCEDGRKVRSRAEVIISNFLFNNKVRAIYEKDVFYEENGVSKCLHPDFYLPDYDIYIEYNELTNKNYLESKKYTQKIYDSLHFKVIIMNDDDLTDVAACLKPKLGMH